MGGWGSPYLAKLTTGDESLLITTNEGSWMVSLVHVCRPLGVIIAALIVNQYGTRKAVLVAGVPHAVASLCFLIDQSVPWIYAARVFGGLGLGMYYSTFPLYIGEISNPKIRGALISLVAQGGTIGYVLGNVLGAYLNMTAYALINLALTALFLFLITLFPESAHYLIKKGRIHQAEESIKWYNRQEDVTVELEALKVFLDKMQTLSLKESFQQLLIPFNRRLMIMINCIYVFMQLSGLYTVWVYLEILLTTLKIDVIAPNVAAVCIGVFAIIGGVTSMYTNDHFGRRSMLSLSALGVFGTFVLIGVHFMLPKHGVDTSNLQWLVIAELMMYIFFLNLGVTNIPSCLLSEIFPPELKGIQLKGTRRIHIFFVCWSCTFNGCLYTCCCSRDQG